MKMSTTVGGSLEAILGGIIITINALNPSIPVLDYSIFAIGAYNIGDGLTLGFTKKTLTERIVVKTKSFYKAHIKGAFA